MQRLYFSLAIIILVSTQAGCAPQVAQPENVKALENPTSTNLPEKSRSIESPISEVVEDDPSGGCPVTVPQDPPFTPPQPYSDMGFQGDFWYGSSSLWTAIPQNGIWSGLPHNPEGYTQKVFWWWDGYDWTEEPEPNLTVTGERLDASAPPLIASKATNAYASDLGSAMLVGVDFPTPGCWKITGKYADAELSFIVWVAP
jgi:hypothetical protein